jgi:hypothetical protein
VPLDVEYATPARFKVRASGEVTLQEIESMFRGLITRPELSGSDMLVDAREVEGVPSTAELRIVAREIMPSMTGQGLGAVGIVTDKPFVYGVARMFAVFAEAVGARVGAFRELDAADQWLTDRRADAKPRRLSPAP